MRNKPDMKYTLFWKAKDEMAVGRCFIVLISVILAFILALLGRPIAGFLHWPWP